MTNLKVIQLDRHRLAEAYPLVRASGPSLDAWLLFGEALARSGGGVLGAEAPDGCFHGIAAFRPIPSLAHGKCLVVDLLVIFELRRNSAVRATLHDALGQVALSSGCRSMQLLVTPAIDPRGHDRLTPLEKLGWAVQAMCLTRSTEAPR